METLDEMKNRKFEELPVPTKNIEHRGLSRLAFDIPPEDFWTPVEKSYSAQSNLFRIATQFPEKFARVKKEWLEAHK